MAHSFKIFYRSFFCNGHLTKNHHLHTYKVFEVLPAICLEAYFHPFHITASLFNHQTSIPDLRQLSHLEPAQDTTQGTLFVRTLDIALDEMANEVDS